MPLPLLIIPAAATSIAGAGTTVRSVLVNHKANRITDDANARVDDAREYLDRSRELCSVSLAKLGEEKLFVLDNSIEAFINSFSRIKNVELEDSLGLEELKKLRIDKESLKELKEMQLIASSIVAGATAGVAGGALTAFGAYGAVTTFAHASTGTAIATLHGAAATNATLAWLGGGALSAGGAGMAGGVVVLGGIVAGPALLALGLITGKKADEKLEVALENSAKADELCTELGNLAFQCDAIRRRADMFHSFLARLDARFVPLVFQLEGVLDSEGDDYAQYSPEAKSTVLRAATLAGTIKAILDTPILAEDGALTVESQALASELGVKLLEA